MEKTLERPAVDVAPREKPTQASPSSWALLAVPGSTLAWDLPAGGLWIGLPLAVAAIAIGIRAHRLLGGTAMATVAVVIGALAIAQMAVYVLVSASS